MFYGKSVYSIRTMCSVVCFWLGLLLIHLPHTVAAIDPTSKVPQKRNGSGPNCTNVRTLFESRGINSNEVPGEPINGKHQFFSDILEIRIFILIYKSRLSYAPQFLENAFFFAIVIVI